jgi:hypothetical protein
VLFVTLYATASLHGVASMALSRRVDLHAIDATPARWRGDAGSSPPVREDTYEDAATRVWMGIARV